jgi:hypothetical protein
VAVGEALSIRAGSGIDRSTVRALKTRKMESWRSTDRILQGAPPRSRVDITRSVDGNKTVPEGTSRRNVVELLTFVGQLATCPARWGSGVAMAATSTKGLSPACYSLDNLGTSNELGLSPR